MEQKKYSFVKRKEKEDIERLLGWKTIEKYTNLYIIMRIPTPNNKSRQKKIFVNFDEYICRRRLRAWKKNYEGNMNGNKSSSLTYIFRKWTYSISSRYFVSHLSFFIGFTLKRREEGRRRRPQILFINR